jgi:hypothetical protein
MMPSEMDRILCCAAMWVLAGFIWLTPQEARSMQQYQANSDQKLLSEVPQGNRADSFQMVNTAINNSSNSAESYLNLGKMYEAKGDGANARQAYQTYIEKMNHQLPRDPEVLLRLRRYGLY